MCVGCFLYFGHFYNEKIGAREGSRYYVRPIKTSQRGFYNIGPTFYTLRICWGRLNSPAAGL